MRVPDGVHAVCARARGAGEHLAEFRPAGEGGAGDVLRVDGVDAALKGAQDLRPPGQLDRQLAEQAVEGPEVRRELPHGLVPQGDVDLAEHVDRGRSRRGPVPLDCGHEAEVRGHVRVGGRLDVEVDRPAGTDLERDAAVARFDGLEDHPVRRPRHPLRLEPGRGRTESEVDDEFRAQQVAHGPARGDHAGHVQPGRSPRPPPGPARPERRVRRRRGLGEADRFTRRLPDRHRQRRARPIDGGAQPLADEAGDPQLHKSTVVMHPAPRPPRRHRCRTVPESYDLGRHASRWSSVPVVERPGRRTGGGHVPRREPRRRCVRTCSSGDRFNARRRASGAAAPSARLAGRAGATP